MSTFRADLHCHSTCSDGTDDPSTLLRLAKEVGLQGLSITDHDTIDAYTPELFAEAEKLGIKLLTGIEISSELNRVPVHILGYGFDVDSTSLKSFLLEMQERRKNRNRTLLKQLAEKNIIITEDELKQFKSPGRPHIAQIMVEKKYVLSIRDAFEFYLHDVSGFREIPYLVIDAIHKANGKAVLAHPHFYHKKSLLREILQAPFDGIECYYARLPKGQEIPMLKVAEERKLIATGGSDYHGTVKPHIPLGCSWVNEHVFASLSR
jgi:predicted metal-dependent phosphoesterase TrpH